MRGSLHGLVCRGARHSELVRTAVIQQMRVGHFLSHYPQPGGSTKAVVGLAGGLESLGHSQKILGIAGLAQATPTRVRGASEFFLRSQALKAAILEMSRMDIVVLHGMFTPACAMIASQLRKKGIPYVAVPH